METFTKLESRIISSTIWAEDDHTRLLWITMLALADRNGYVGASVPGLANIARIPLESAERAIEKFLAPDKYSRSQEHEGRRIKVVERGWLLLNHGRIREMRDAEERREQNRDAKRRERQQPSVNVSHRQQPSANVSNVSRRQPPSAHTDTDTDTEQIQSKEESTPMASSPLAGAPKWRSRFTEAWNEYPRKERRKEAVRHYNATVKSDADHQRLMTAMENWAAQMRREHRDADKLMQGGTWFNNWQDWEEAAPERQAPRQAPLPLPPQQGSSGPATDEEDPWRAREREVWGMLPHEWVAANRQALDAKEPEALDEFYEYAVELMEGPPARAWVKYTQFEKRFRSEKSDGK